MARYGVKAVHGDDTTSSDGEQQTADDLRFADGPSVEVDVVIEASVEVVWSLVSDIELPARFSSEFAGATWIDDGPHLGARFVGRNHHSAIGDWETTATIAEFEPGAVFGWVIGDPDHPSASWRFSIEPTEKGIRLTQWMRIGPAPSGITPAIEAMPAKEGRILRRRLAEHRANMEATLLGVKTLAEQ